MSLFKLTPAAIFAATLAAAPAAAINLDTAGADNAAPSSPAYRDAAGVWRILAPGQRSAVPARATNQLTGNNTIEISYRDLARDNGVGFDNPQQGQQRRDILTQVLTEIDTLIEDGGTLAIEVQASETDGGGALASASTFFPTAPNGFHSGAAMTHLTTGSDPFPGVPDMLLTVDFGYNWNSSMNPPASDEVDLYSVLIHEIIHGLGLISLSDSDGTSLVSGGTPGVFSTFDSFLHTGTGIRLWSGDGRFRGLSSDLVGLDAGVEFRGANATGEFGTPVPVHAPEPYAQGSSLAHWRYMPETNDSIMQPAFGYGASYRMPRAHEVGALVDLGYSIQSTGSDDGETFDFAVVDGSWLNPQTPGEGIFLDYGPSLDILFRPGSHSHSLPALSLKPVPALAMQISVG